MPENQPEVRALLFDVFGTVVDWRSGVSAQVAKAAAERGLSIDAEAFAEDWRGRYQPSMAPIRAGLRPFALLDTLHRESLDQSLTQFGVDHAFDDDAREDLNRAWWRLDPWPDVVAGLTRLKRRYFIAPCSNGNIALIANMAKRAGLPWDTVLGAETARAYKPTSECYRRSAAQLGLRPERCMMVAAHNSDLAAARAAGLQTGFVARPTEHGANQMIDLTPSADWEVVAKDFEDLASRLGA